MAKLYCSLYLSDSGLWIMACIATDMVVQGSNLRLCCNGELIDYLWLLLCRS